MKTQHDSDCAVHNEPAYPNGPCDCGAMTTPTEADRNARVEEIKAAVADRYALDEYDADVVAMIDPDIAYLLAENARQAAELDRLTAERVELVVFVMGHMASHDHDPRKLVEAFVRSR